MQENKQSQQLRLRDGRRLGYAEYGASSGNVLFYFHGWPSSRFEPRLLHARCVQLGLRLVAPDRPGYGLSDFQILRRLLDWPKDVCELADHLGAKSFAVMGVSGGGPYAVTCAAVVPERIEVLLLVCSVAPSDSPETLEGMVPLNRWLLTFARRAPWLAEKCARLCMKVFWKRGAQVVPSAIAKRLPRLDQQALEHQELRDTLITSSIEAFRNGVRAAAADGLLFARPWGFNVEDVRVQSHLWHGESDVIVPPAMGRCLTRRLPNCNAQFYPEDGHFSLPYYRAGEILSHVPG